MKAVVAMSMNRVIGRGGEIPWHLPEDFKWFKELTSGGIVLMGRKTFESLPKPLPNRTNVVFTRAPRMLAGDRRFAEKCGGKPLIGHWSARLKRAAFQLAFDRLAPRDVWLVRGVSRFLKAVERHRPRREVFVIGGAQVYKALLPKCSDLYLSLVYREVEGDAFFPEFDEWFSPRFSVVRKASEFEVRHYKHR